MPAVQTIKGDQIITSSVAIGHPSGFVFQNDGLNVIDLSGSLIIRGSGSVPVSPTGSAAFYFDITARKLRASEDGAAYVDVIGSAVGAPTDVPYIVLAGNATLTKERVLTGTANQITITDGGAGNAVTLSLPQDINTFSNPTFGNLSVASVLTSSQIALRTLSVGATNNVNIPTTDAQVIQLVAGSDFTKGAGFLLGGRNAVGGLVNKGSIITNIGNLDGTNFFSIQSNDFTSSTNNIFYINGGSQNTYMAAEGGEIGKVAIGIDPFIGISLNSALDLSGAITFREMFTPPSVSPSHTSLIYYDQATNKTKISENGSAFVNLLSAGGSPGGLSGSIQFNSVSSFSGSARVFIENTGNLFLKDNTIEPWPAGLSGSILYSKFRAGRRLIATNDQTRWDYSLQPFLATNKVNIWTAWGNSLSTSSFGFNMFLTGTLAVRNVLTTNMFTSIRKIGFQTAAAVSGVAGIRHGSSQFWRGNQPRLGGFYYLSRFGIGSGSQGAVPHFVGLTGSTINPIAGSNPSQLFNLVGVGCDVGDINLNIYAASSTGRTKISLGSNFPVTAPFSSDLYEVRLYSPPSGSSIFYSVERMNTGDLIEGKVDETTSTIPNNITMLAPIVWISTKSASVASIDVVSQYLETDN